MAGLRESSTDILAGCEKIPTAVVRREAEGMMGLIAALSTRWFQSTNTPQSFTAGVTSMLRDTPPIFARS
jgi:hypothetical protein